MRVALGPASWTAFKSKKPYKRKKDLILTKLGIIYVQKSTTFINTCDFSVNLIPALVCMKLKKLVINKHIFVEGAKQYQLIPTSTNQV